MNEKDEMMMEEELEELFTEDIDLIEGDAAAEEFDFEKELGMSEEEYDQISDYDTYINQCLDNFMSRKSGNADLMRNSNYYYYIQKIKDYPVLTHEQLIDTFRKWKETGNDEYKEMLTCSNLRLVITFSKKFMNQGLDSMELIQEGNIGLNKAINHFDYTSGNKFSTYAIWWIRQTIQRAIQNTARAVRVPIHIGDCYNRIKKATRELNALYGREPSVEEIAEHLDLKPEYVTYVIDANREIVSIETPINNKKGDDSVTIQAFIADERITPSEYAMQSVLADEMVELFKKVLSPKEAAILTARYGLNGQPALSLEQAGKKFGLSRERIRQIEREAKNKLKAPCENADLREFIS